MEYGRAIVLILSETEPICLLCTPIYLDLLHSKNQIVALPLATNYNQAMSSGIVYFIQAENGPIKIGHTRGDPTKRMQALQIGSPVRLTVLASLEGTYRLEKQLHEKFSQLRLIGEWFKPEQELLALIEDAKRDGNRPIPPPTPGPKPQAPRPKLEYAHSGIDYASEILRILNLYPHKEFSAKQLSIMIGSGRYAEIPMRLQSLYEGEKIVRVARGRYKAISRS